MTMTEDAKAAVVLASSLGRRDRPALPPALWRRLVQALQDAGLRPGDLFRSDVDAIGKAAIPEEFAERIRVLIEDTVAVVVEIDTLAGKGIRPVTIEDAAYPDRYRSKLGTQAPPVLFVVGDRTLLEHDGVGIVGSRNVDEDGAGVAGRLAEEAARAGRTVISGGARGVDRLAMAAAFEAGGSVVGVLADSLAGRIRKPDTLRALDSGRICLITHQHPGAGFGAGAAVARNKLIYALAKLTVVVAADRGRGGTWEGASEALRSGYGRVAVWRGGGEGPGNAALQERGAEPIRAVGELCDLVDADTPEPPAQMSMLE